MSELRQIERVVVRLDANLGRTILRESPPGEVRMAPSLRGVDLAEAGGVILISVGVAADLMTLILAREAIADFARRAVSLFWRDAGTSQAGHLTIDVTSTAGKLSVDLETNEGSRLAEALNALAKVVEIVTPEDDQQALPR